MADGNISQHARLVTQQDDGLKALSNKYTKTNLHFPGRRRGFIQPSFIPGGWPGTFAQQS